MGLTNNTMPLKAFSNPDKSFRASNFIYRSSYAPQTLPDANVEPFTKLGEFYSYSTVIAVLMRNNMLNKTELWLTTQRYSPTTDRHMAQIESARRKFGDCPQYEYSLTDAYYRHDILRNHSARRLFTKTIMTFMSAASTANKHTRVHIGSAVAYAHQALKCLRTDVPETVQDTNAIMLVNTHLQTLLSFLNEDIYPHETPQQRKNLRTACAAYVALNNDN